MQLVSDATASPIGQHQRTLVAKRIGMFVAAELAPHRVKLSRHSQIGLADCTSIGRRKWKVVVAPTARRKGLDLKMAEMTEHRPVALREMPGIMKHRQVSSRDPCCGVRCF